MPLPPTSPVRVQPYFGYRNRHKLVLTARALRQRKARFAQGGQWQALRTMLRQFASREVPDLAVRLEATDDHGMVLIDLTGVTDKEGFVRFEADLAPEWDLPEHPVWETVRLHWINAEGPQVVDAHVLAPGRDGRLAVISDIDDTIVETGITGGLRQVMRNWKRVLAQMPRDRAAVPGADTFYGTLGGGQVLPEGELRPGARIPATRRPFFYVSSSPWNLFSYLVAFMQAKNLPLGPILLRDWGLNSQTFGKESHGLHKSGAIDAILAMYPDTSFALIGDDTQGDLPAFAKVATGNPGRITAIFLRMVSTEALSAEELAAKDAIEAAGVPLWIGDSYKVGEDFLDRIGVTPGGETTQIVHTVEDVDDPPEPEGAATAG